LDNCDEGDIIYYVGEGKNEDHADVHDGRNKMLQVCANSTLLPWSANIL